MKHEFSAGGVVYKKDPSATSGQGLLILVCQHAHHHGWVFPKGLIGDHTPGEQKETTAVREVEEETGVQAKILRELEPISYWYQFKGQKIKKTVQYYLMEFISEDPSKRDNEMEAVAWLPPEEIEQKLSFKSDKKVWQETQKLLGLSS